MPQYSLETWGRTQRDRYKARIDRALWDLPRFPNLGRARDELLPGLRSHPVGQHVVFYRVTDDEIIISRIIHGRRDIDAVFGVTRS